ncbi:DUF5009 domain-containing protein [Bacteroides faecis]|uniref:DUF5009 domain-containing protein n=1 Tax=Bacteroides faecis TaxID=674529 RepID=UPI0021666278|nr:DUF5009 domain-containing protein [Bacteroides faecis]MCS3070085.1 DUF5009 domain-containing protein [Bacteroides faecis]
MAIFGSLIYTFTINKPWIRIGILPFIWHYFWKENPESWNHAVLTFSPLPWMYQFAYLKYLFIVIPRYDCRRVSVRMAAEQTDNAIYSFQQ